MAGELTDAALSARELSAAVLLYADFLGDPLRAAMAPMTVTTPPAWSGDPELDGFGWSIIDPRALSISDPEHAEGGSDQLTLTLSATPLDTAVMNAIDNPALYSGRVCRVWVVLIDSAGTAVAWQHFYTGYMSQVVVDVSGDEMTAAITVENFAALLSTAPGRTYLTQSLYDAADQSGAVSRGSMNGQSAVGWGGGGSGSRSTGIRNQEV